MDQITITGQAIDLSNIRKWLLQYNDRYLETTNGQNEIEYVCGTYKMVVKDRQLEQLIIRLVRKIVRHYNPNCSPLLDLLVSKMQQYDEMTCAAFAMGMAIHGCEQMEEGEAMGDMVATNRTSMTDSVGVKFFSIITIICSIVIADWKNRKWYYFLITPTASIDYGYVVESIPP